jgi:hypothetical protein
MAFSPVRTQATKMISKSEGLVYVGGFSEVSDCIHSPSSSQKFPGNSNGKINMISGLEKDEGGKKMR